MNTHELPGRQATGSPPDLKVDPQKPVESARTAENNIRYYGPAENTTVLQGAARRLTPEKKSTQNPTRPKTK